MADKAAGAVAHQVRQLLWITAGEVGGSQGCADGFNESLRSLIPKECQAVEHRGHRIGVKLLLKDNLQALSHLQGSGQEPRKTIYFCYVLQL